MQSSPLRIGFWLVVAFVAATLAFAPQAASAREGHQQGHHCSPGPQASHVSHAVTPPAGALAVPHTIEDVAVHARQFFDPPVSADNFAECDGACCFGLGCCPAAIAAAAQDFPPPPKDGLTPPPPSLGRPSAARASLLEPPNAAA